jgi:hypothetical protein
MNLNSILTSFFPNLRGARLLLLIGAGFAFNAHAQIQSSVYAASSENFLNPERGFHTDVNLVTDRDMTWVRQQGYTLARSYVRLDAYRNAPLPASLLTNLTAGFDAARRAGIKVIPRFSYNFPELGETQPDAPLPRVLQHVAQLKPVLSVNADVIAVMQASFIGLWGEWHTSTNGLDTPEAKRQVLNAVLAALPASRMAQIRYPGDFLHLYPTPLTAAEAFNGSNKARTGHHNDCFLANADDAGTYWPPEKTGQFKRYLDLITRYVPVGGETCQVTPQVSRTDCPTALREMSRWRWSYINAEFFLPALQQWKNEGCYDTIARRMGHRLRLLSSEIPREAQRGGAFAMNFTVTNGGWASPFNARKVQIVLREKTRGTRYVFNVNTDPRKWFAGTSVKVNVTATLPAAMIPGTYDVLLNLPDPAAKLSARAEYAIRLANSGTWENATGFNNLLRSVIVR